MATLTLESTICKFFGQKEKKVEAYYPYNYTQLLSACNQRAIGQIECTSRKCRTHAITNSDIVVAFNYPFGLVFLTVITCRQVYIFIHILSRSDYARRATLQIYDLLYIPN